MRGAWLFSLMAVCVALQATRVSGFFDIQTMLVDADITSLIDLAGVALTTPMSCADIKTQRATADDGRYSIDPDGAGGSGPIEVYCEFSGGKAVTVIHHNSEFREREDRKVDNCEEPGSCRFDIIYGASLKQVKALADLSSSCEQYISYTAYASVLWWERQCGDRLYGWWEDRNGAKMLNWGGAPTGTSGCACSKTTEGCKDRKMCNANSNTQTETEDAGFLTDKDYLPVTALRFGDTGQLNDDEYGYYKLGPLKCQGGPTSVEQEVPIFNTNTDYRYRYNLPQLKPGDCRVEFEVAACNDVFIGFSRTKDEQNDLFELNIGGWGNAKTGFRLCKQCQVHAWFVEKQIVKCGVTRGFWVDWCDSCFHFGRAGEAEVMSWCPNKVLDIKYLAYTTGFGSSGKFKFDTFFAKEIVTCESGVASINCGTRLINVLTATYGRNSPSICLNEHIKTNTCGATKSFSVVGHLCHNQTSCRVTVNNGVFGDPCSGTYKYLRVKYQCLEQGRKKQFTSIGCLGHKCNPRGGECVPIQSSYKCSCKTAFGGEFCEKEYAQCRAWGDPHYTQFSGRNFNFQGRCKYILAQTCTSNSNYHFRVIGVNIAAPWNNKVSFNRRLEVQIGATEINLNQERQVIVNNDILNVPCRVGKDIVIDNDGKFLVLSSKSHGVKVLWDGREVYKIYMDKAMYMDNVCGLCGTIKPHTNGIFIKRDGTETTNINEFGISWTSNPLTCASCENCVSLRHCDQDADLFNQVKEACFPIKDPQGVFRVGHAQFNPEDMYSTCVFDLCSRSSFDGDMRCNNLEEYANRILIENRQQYLRDESAIISWRVNLDCPYRCPQGSLYTICVSNCQRTCFQRTAPEVCSMTCVEGCDLAPGFVMESGVPTPEKDCGCRYDNKYFHIDQKWMNTDCTEMCVCEAGGFSNCHPVSCVNHAFCGSLNQVHGCHCEPNYIGDGSVLCQIPCPSSMGNAVKLRANVDEGEHAIIDMSRPITCEGYIRAFSIKRNTDTLEPVTLIVWRRSPAEETKFVIVGSARLDITDDSLDLCTCDNSKIPVRAGDYVGFISFRGTVLYDVVDQGSGKVWQAPYFESVEPMKEVQFTAVEGIRAYSIAFDLESCNGKRVPSFMFSDYLGVQSGEIPNEAMSASSALGQYAASQARLDNAELGACAWTPLTAEKGQWLQVHLPKGPVVIGVVSQGHCGLQDPEGSPIGCVTQFNVQYSMDGQTFEYATDDKGEPDVFLGRCRCQTHIKNFFRNAVKTRYIRFLPVSWKTAISMRVEIIGKDIEDVQTEVAVVGQSIDVANTAVAFIGKPFKRNAFLKGLVYHPTNQIAFMMAVLRPTGDANTFNLVGRKYITTDGEDKVQHFDIKDENEQTPVQVGDVLCLVFQEPVIGFEDDAGTGNAASKVLTATISMDQFKGTALGGDVTFTNRAMRRYNGVEPKFRVATTKSIPPVMSTGSLGVKKGEVKDDQLTASSYCDANSKAPRARLGQLDQQGMTGGWCAKESDKSGYIQVDFRTRRRCAGIVTQGLSSTFRKWFTQKYIVKCSGDMNTWLDITNEAGKTIEFSGNYDQETEVTNYFRKIWKCRGIRIFPTMWVGDFAALRFDVLGLPEAPTVKTEVGFDVKRRDVSGSSGFTIVIPEKKFESDGFVTGVRFLAIRRGSFKLMIFRAVNEATKTYEVVGRRHVRIKKRNIEVNYRFRNGRNGDDKFISVKKGDMLGMTFSGSVLYKSNDGTDVTRLVYARTRQLKGYRKLGPGKRVTFTDDAVKRSYSLVALFQPITEGEVVSSVDAQEPLGLENNQFPDERITASSTHVSGQPLDDFSPRFGRLKNEGGESAAWVPKDTDTAPWIQVETEESSVFTGVVLQGCHSLMNWWVTKFTVQYSTDGNNWLPVMDCNKQKAIFNANTDSDTAVTVFFCNAINGRFLRILPTEWNDRAGLRFEVLGDFDTAATEYGASCIQRENVDSRNYILLAAGSPFESDGYVTEWKFFPISDKPFKAGVWRADPKDNSRYRHIGSSDIPGQKANVLVSYRLDDDAQIPFRKGDFYGLSFTEPVIPFDSGDEGTDLMYADNGGDLDPVPIGSYKKFKFSGKEAYSIGCSVKISNLQSVPAVACRHRLGMESNLIPDQEIESSSVLHPSYGHAQARLNTKATEATKGCWAPSADDKDQFIMVTLETPSLVTGISIQGCNGDGEKRKVTSFRVQILDQYNDWVPMLDKKDSEIFKGNTGTDSDKIVDVFFNSPLKTTAVRLHPVEWVEKIGLRFEVLGCLTVCEERLGAKPLMRNWRRATDDSSMVIMTEDAIPCNSFIKGWRFVPKNHRSVTFYVLNKKNNRSFKIVGKTRVPKSRSRKRGEMFEVLLPKEKWIQVRSGYVVGFTSRRQSPIYIDKRAHDKSGYIIAQKKKIRRFNRLRVGDRMQIRKYRAYEASFSFNAILSQKGVGKARDAVPPVSCSGSMGMENGAIHDKSIQASSSTDVLKRGPAEARLKGPAAWTASQLDESPWIQIIFGYKAILTGVVTQGDPVNDAWVTSFSLEYTNMHNYISKEPTNLQWVKFTNDLKDIFPGNVDQNTAKTSYFKKEIEAQLVRLHVEDFHTTPSMRFDFIGCPVSDPCKPNPCKNGALCRKSQASLGYTCQCPVEWGGKNCDKKMKKCCAYGDPHYCNFDGKRFNFQGDCRYYLARTINTSPLEHFEIWADNIKSRSRSTVSLTREVFVRIGDLNFDFKQNRELSVNNERITCPYERDGIAVIDGINGRIVLKTEFGLTVSWDGKHKVDVHLTEDYMNQVEGLCGNYNGRQGDDYIIRSTNAQTTNINKFAESWGTDPSCPGCVGCEERDECRLLDKVNEAQEACKVLVNPQGPFAMCHKTFDPKEVYESCMFDFCALFPGQEGLCKNIDVYASECSDANIQVGVWRKPGFCAFDCPVGMTLTQIGTQCPNTCGNQQAAEDCTGKTGPSCGCMQGMFLEDNRCVPDAECGCTHDGVYHKKGVKFMSNDCTLICFCDVEHNPICEDVQCHSKGACSISEGVRGCFCDEGWAGDGVKVCDEILDPKDAVVCQGAVFSIDCLGEKIEILAVEYGTAPRAECPDTANNAETFSHKYAKTIIKALCNDRSKCSSPASSLTFGSFARGTRKALYVRYQCREAVTTSIASTEVELIACQNQRVVLECRASKVDIIRAEFGRGQGEDVCDQPNDVVLNENCVTRSAYHQVLQLCHGMSMCNILPAPSSLGTDPCPDTSKYLRVVFQCNPNPDPKVLEDDKCEPNPCVNGKCEAISIEPKYNCKCDVGFTGKHCDKGKATCKALGDPHYINFDGKEFDFMGSCKYTLVTNKGRDSPDFEVIVYNEAARRNPAMSSTVQVEFRYNNQVIMLKHGGETLLDGRTIEGLQTPNLTISVNYPDVVVTTSIGVEIRWDGMFMVEVDVTGDYFDSTEGLCGIYNGNPDDDFFTRFGETVTDPVAFGQSWFVPGNDGCEDCKDCVLPEPCDDAAMKAAAQEVCSNIISDAGPFQQCHNEVSSSFFYQSCVTDRCTMPDGLAHCEDYHSYAEACKAKGIIISWRRLDFCFIDCLAKNMMYSPSSSSCPGTCANPDAESTCNQADKEDCVCQLGMVKEGDTCINKDECGCVQAETGIYYKNGESFMTMDCGKVCQCSNQELMCEIFTCPLNEECATVANMPACKCKEGYFRDTDSKSCEAIPVPQVLIRPQLQLECSTIDCGAGFVNIIAAKFGPTLAEPCGDGGTDACDQPHSLDIMRSLCQGRSQCILDAVTAQSFGEPCPDALNYISTRFSCTHKPMPFAAESAGGVALKVCEDRPAHLVCPLDQAISLDSVFFGRRAGDAYCLGKDVAVTQEDLSEATALDKAKGVCGAASSACVLSGGIFGDSWAESKEYLEVTYSCIPKLIPE